MNTIFDLSRRFSVTQLLAQKEATRTAQRAPSPAKQAAPVPPEPVPVEPVKAAVQVDQVPVDQDDLLTTPPDLSKLIKRQ